MNKTFRHGVLAMAIAAAMPVLAQVPLEATRKQGATLEATLGAERTDNAFKTSFREEDETKSYIDLGLGYRRSGDILDADVLYHGELANYENDTTDDDTVLTGSGRVSWKLLPDRLQLDLSHERSEQLRDSRNPDIRNNRILRDIVTAGPTFRARMSPVDALVVSGRYVAVSYDDSDRTPIGGAQNSDSERTQGSLGWEHSFSETDVLSLHYEYMDTEFDSFTEEFQYQRLFATYAVRLRQSGYSISVGANRSERDSTGSNDGFLVRANWNLQTGEHQFRLNGVNELTDSGIGLGGSTEGGGLQLPDSNFDVIDVVERSSIDFDWQYGGVCERCSVSLGVFYDDQDFDTQPRDQEQIGYRGSFGYRLTPTLTAALTGSYAESEYTQDVGGGRRDERTGYGITLDWELSRSLSMRAWLMQDERDSDDFGQEYNELYGGLSLRYTFR